MVLAALAAETEPDLDSDHIDVAVPQRGQAVGSVFLPVLVVPNPDSRLFQKANNCRQDLLPWHPGSLQVLIGTLADPGQSFGEGEHAIVLDRVPDLPPPRVVPILFPAARIAPSRLQVATGVGTDPDIGPGGRNGPPLDPPEGSRVADRAAVPRGVTQALPDSPPPGAAGGGADLSG